ncbi:hypothetical protein [uncultured Stenotrophomonas sp.]|uniref:hypothetical protein n=1 Tax=uncultured Stenotrophomonas sp. TaxID=165438 RepID=UPI0025F3EF51|nr:hypothetical protein [uncultured Stenotrophomonas sp.]
MLILCEVIGSLSPSRGIAVRDVSKGNHLNGILHIQEVVKVDYESVFSMILQKLSFNVPG